MPDSAIARLNDLARKEGRSKTLAPTSEPVQSSVRKSVSFAAAPTGETEDPIVSLNDELQAETGEVIPHDNAGSDEMVEHLEQDVGVHTESGTAVVDTNYDASDAPEEPVEAEPSSRRTMMDMFRNGTDETALTANSLLIRKSGVITATM